MEFKQPVMLAEGAVAPGSQLQLGVVPQQPASPQHSPPQQQFVAQPLTPQPAFIPQQQPVQQQQAVIQVGLSYEALLDPPGKSVYYMRIPASNKGTSQQRVVAQVTESGNRNVLPTARHTFHQMKDRTSPRDLFVRMMLPDEKLLTDRTLQFSRIEWQDEKGALLEVKYSPGELHITNERVVLVACAGAEVSTLKEEAVFNPGGQAQHGYNVEANVADNVWYFPIPLKNFRHVELNCTAGSQINELVSPKAPECCGCVWPCWPLCSCCCVEEWKGGGAAITKAENRRSVNFGVLWPPWNVKRSIVVHVDERQPLTDICSTIAQFQRSAPYIMKAAHVPPMPGHKGDEFTDVGFTSDAP